MGNTPALFTDGELAPVPEGWATQALGIWNDIAGRVGWPLARFLTQSRRAALRRAIKDYGGVSGFKTHLEGAAKNDFLLGKTPRDPKHASWHPDFDWFLKPSTVIKILEGKFSPTVAPPKVTAAAAVDWRDRLHKYRKGGFWPASWGNRPEDRGPHLARPEHIAEWRQAHGVREPAAALAETAEQRLEASIASLRRHGFYDRANIAEEKLARLQGRPPVLVPASDVSGLGMPPKPPGAPAKPVVSDVDIIPEPPAWLADEPPELDAVPE